MFQSPLLSICLLFVVKWLVSLFSECTISVAVVMRSRVAFPLLLQSLVTPDEQRELTSTGWVGGESLSNPWVVQYSDCFFHSTSAFLIPFFLIPLTSLPSKDTSTGHYYLHYYLRYHYYLFTLSLLFTLIYTSTITYITTIIYNTDITYTTNIIYTFLHCHYYLHYHYYLYYHSYLHYHYYLYFHYYLYYH